MAKVVVKKLAKSTARQIGARGAAISSKRVGDLHGGSTTLVTIDADSKTFANDLTYVFGKNVAKARRENKRITGALDGVPAKG